MPCLGGNGTGKHDSVPNRRPPGVEAVQRLFRRKLSRATRGHQFPPRVLHCVHPHAQANKFSSRILACTLYLCRFPSEDRSFARSTTHQHTPDPRQVHEFPFGIRPQIRTSPRAGFSYAGTATRFSPNMLCLQCSFTYMACSQTRDPNSATIDNQTPWSPSPA